MPHRRELFPPDRGLQVRMVLAAVLTPLVVVAAVVAGAVFLPVVIAVVLAGAAVIGVATSIVAALWKRWRARRANDEPAPATPELHAAVERVCALADVPKPELLLMDEGQPNSWVIASPGRRPRLHVTSGLLELLEPGELDAVIAHEIAHVAHRDATVMTVVGGPSAALRTGGRAALELGFFGMGGLVAIAIGLVAELGTSTLSRYRELSADAASAALTGRPMALASALTKVSGGIERFPTKDLREVAGRDGFHLVAVNAQHGPWANHPPLSTRIARLEAMEHKLHAARPALPAD